MLVLGVGTSKVGVVGLVICSDCTRLCPSALPGAGEGCGVVWSSDGSESNRSKVLVRGEGGMTVTFGLDDSDDAYPFEMLEAAVSALECELETEREVWRLLIGGEGERVELWSRDRELTNLVRKLGAMGNALVLDANYVDMNFSCSSSDIISITRKV